MDAREADDDLSRMDDAAEQFIEHAISSMQGRRLDGMRIALDNANGAFQNGLVALK